MEKQPRQHHTVSSTYLELFNSQNSDRIYVLDLHNGDIRFQKPEKVLRRRDYYRQKPAHDGDDEFRFEKMMASSFEPNIKRVIKKLICGGKEISEEELTNFIQFLELQHLKVPVQAELAKECMRKLVEMVAINIPEMAENIKTHRYRIKIKDEYRFIFMHEMLKEQKHFWYFSRMIWKIWTMPESFHLVTTGTPVTIFNPDFPDFTKAGIGRLGSVVLFPLTPKYCLEMIHSERENAPDFNPSSIIEVEPGDVKIEIRAGKIMPEGKAKAINIIIAMRADRVVVSDDKPTLEKIWSCIKKPDN
ncbi:MAG: DUF4238 domain-containing protein [Lentisphaeria bacterium]